MNTLAPTATGTGVNGVALTVTAAPPVQVTTTTSLAMIAPRVVSTTSRPSCSMRSTRP